MIRPLRGAAALLAATALSGCAVPNMSMPRLGGFGFGQNKAPATPLKLAPGQWAQARSDVPADPEIRFGALPSGMRYALRRQQVPAGQAALRLRFDAGSLQETDAQAGLAHFLEHMAFNGSKNVPEGDMIKILERLGLAFGADTNASTDLDETIYKLDLPRTDAETVDTSLMLLREAAGNLTIDQAAVDRERGVVLSEERARDNPASRVYRARQAFLLKDQLPPRRDPIGKVEVLQNAPASLMVDYYQRYYRPERAVLVAAGDFDLDAMEAKIKARFGDWTATGPAGPDPILGPVAPRTPEAKLVIEAGAPLSLQLAWIQAPDNSPDGLARRRRDLIESLGFQVLNRRFSTLARAADPPFLGAGAFNRDEYDAAELTMVTVNAEASRWKDALTAAEQEQRRAIRYGVRQDELDREIEELRANVKADVAGAATRTPGQLANEIIGSLSDNEVVTNPGQDAALFEAAVKGLKAEQVSAALRAAFDGAGPLIFMTSPRPIQGGEPALLAALEASRKLEVTPPTGASAVAWPYETFGAPGKVASTKDAADLDTTFVTFENGVRLTIKPTRFKDDEVLVRVNVGGGRVDMPRDRQSGAWAASTYVEGGLAKISAEDMERVLARRVYGAQFSIGDDAFVLTGGTRSADLDIQLQVLAAYVAEPGWRPEAFARLKSASKTFHDQYESTDSGVLSRDLGGLLRSGDERWVFPSRSEMADAKLTDLKDQISPAIASGPIEVVIVGDITVEKATELVAATFGALPSRAPAPAADPAKRQVAFPAGVATPVQRIHKGRADQAIGYLAWPTNGFFANPQKARDTAVMGEVLELRLIEELRESQGATYSPQVSYNHSMVWPSWGYVSANVEIPPEKLPAFFADVRKIAADLRAKDITQDELDRAKKPRIDQFEKARETNGYWLNELSGAQADPRRLEATRAILPGTERVTIADVRRAAQEVLVDDKMWMLEIKPAK
ncbi:pitrilysin family protein [Phenylobacterium sp.]|uniref:M16 family metallopeptidase n=1 Tax=Phenylobacterium sp. TaxID=1871053 RepID=UPI0027375F75|nr:M16 family metallopeptidase [Phenylobacterium sp.]MDP3634227.1 insulinase family protein [Phenylobacterium sp.]